MKNVLYKGTVRSLQEVNDSKPEFWDGETPDLVYLTEEVNGFALWFYTFDANTLIEFFQHNRDRAIEAAVDFTREKRKELLGEA